jgi:hypothetical protein
MSIIYCDKCSRLIDSDDDPDCFVDVSQRRYQWQKHDMVICEACRDQNDQWEYEHDNPPKQIKGIDR